MKGVFVQIISTIILCYACMGLGITFAWPSSTLLLFTSPNTTLHRPMTEREASLLGSLSSIGALISNPLAAIFLDRIGRKNCSIITACMCLIGWSLTIISNRVEIVLAAILIFGLCGSIVLITPVFISEFCEESMRGSMTSLVLVFNGLGMLVSNLLGSCLSYAAMTWTCTAMSTVGVLLLLILKESPVLLMKKGREEEAKVSIAFYKGAKKESKEVLQEMEKIRRIVNPEPETATPEEIEKLNPESTEPKKTSFIEFLSMVVVMVYARPLFQKVVPEKVMSSAVCSILLFVISIVSSLVAGLVTDKAGRRLLMLASSFGTGICCVTVGCVITFEWGPQWMIAVFIYLYTVLCTVGAGTVPFILLSELFLPEVKSFTSMLVMEWAWLCNFCLLYIFQPLVVSVGIGPVFFVFAIISLLTTVFCFFFLPETKGLSIDVIQTLLVKKRKVENLS